MIFTPTVPLADIVHDNYLLLPIINRFGITLGFGSKTVDEVCREYDINTNFFLEVVNAYNNKDFFPEHTLQGFSIRLIVDYLKNTHDYFLNVKIPQIGDQIAELLASSSPQNKDKVLLVQKFFKEYTNELVTHTLHEDADVYPYAIDVEQYFLSGNIDAEFREKMRQNSINNYALEHGNIDEKLFDLKNIIIKYLPPLSNCNLQNSILFGLFNLERDVKAHASLEEKVLIPKVLRMEKELLATVNK